MQHLVALLGELTDLPLLDLLVLLARRSSSGRVAVIVFPDNKRYEIHLDDGKIAHVSTPAGPCPDDIMATMGLVDVLTTENGSFVWERGYPLPDFPKLEMPVESTIMHALSIGDEISHGPKKP